MADEDKLVEFSAQFGTPYIWQFGAVHKVKPEEDADGFVHSFEELPLHWDLSMLPADNEFVRKNPRFSASLFALYCKTAPQHGEGQTTLVDARNILRQVPLATLAEWEKLDIRYHTKFTYFGGDARVYPLVEAHPETGEAVLRFQENSNSELQKFFVDVEERADDYPNLVGVAGTGLCAGKPDRARLARRRPGADRQLQQPARPPRDDARLARTRAVARAGSQN